MEKQIPVGLDVGTGFVKVSSMGKKILFPSLYSCTYSQSGDSIISGKIEKEVLREAVGAEAQRMGQNRKAILVRPVKHGMPHNDHGFSALAKEALRRVGIKDESVSVAVGVTFGAGKSRNRLKKIIDQKIGTGPCRIFPQAYGTMIKCGVKHGIVINIGHGTTEIMNVWKGGMDGISISKASEFVLSQLTESRDAYVDYDEIFKKNTVKASRLVGLLAEHISDEISRMDVSGPVILSGGGALLPTMKESLEKMLGSKLTIPDDPTFSNAQGLEMLASRF